MYANPASTYVYLGMRYTCAHQTGTYLLEWYGSVKAFNVNEHVWGALKCAKASTT